MTTVADRNSSNRLVSKTHHHHHHIVHNHRAHSLQSPLSSSGGDSTMLFTPTPVAAPTPTMATSAAAASVASPTTAFPFPPPSSPLFMSTFNSLLSSSSQSNGTSSTHHTHPSHHHQQSQLAAAAAAAAAAAGLSQSLSPWLNSDFGQFFTPNKELLEQLASRGDISGFTLPPVTTATADDNNNELSQHQHPTTPPKHRSRPEVMDCETTSTDRHSPQQPEMRNSLSAATASGPANSHDVFKSFMLNSFGQNIPGVSPTFGHHPSAARPPPPSPSQNSPYPFPLLYQPYFASQQQQQQSSGRILSPNQAHPQQPTPPFLLPGSSSSSQHSISPTSHLSAFTPTTKSTADSEFSHSAFDTPTDLSKSLKSEHTASSVSLNGLKRKSPVVEESNTSNVPSLSSVGSTTSTASGAFRQPDSVESQNGKSQFSGSRKHRILKPPNINIQEYSSSTNSNYLNSPMFPPPTSSHSQFTGGVPSSPFNFGLEHIPLSAPPVAQSAASGRFEFPGSNDTLGAAHQFASSNDLTHNNKPPHHQLHPNHHHHNQHHHHTKQQQSNHSNISQSFPTASASTSSLPTAGKQNFPSSIMKENKPSSSNSSNKKSTSDSRVTFQVPAAPGSLESQQQQQQQQNKAKNRYWGSQYPNYQRGTEVLLSNGALKPIEQLAIQDFAVEDENVKMELAEIANVIEKKKGIIRIGFIIGQNRSKYSVDMPIEHPFFVYQKGWSSYSPDLTRKRYGLKCTLLTKGSFVVTVTNKVHINKNKRTGSTGSLSSGSLSSSNSSLNSTPMTTPGPGCIASSSSSSSSAVFHSSRTGPSPRSSHNRQKASKDDEDDVEIDVENE